MLGFSPLAASTLGDLGVTNYDLAANNVTTGSVSIEEAVSIIDGLVAGQSVITQSPSIDTTAISQNHAIAATYNGNAASVPNGTMFEDETFSAPNVVTGTVRVPSAVLSENNAFQSSDINTQNPTVSNTNITQSHNFSPQNVEAQAVIIDSATVTLGFSFAAPDISLGSIVIDATSISQIHNVSATDITFGNPSIATSAISQVHSIDTDNTETNAPTLSNATSFSTVTFTVTIVGGNPSDHPYYNVGSANKYAINGSTATADVALTLLEGRTYRFDQSDSSNSNHPLRFSTTANGTHASGTEYTNGVTVVGTAGQSGAYTEITIETGAPQLYYYCSNHSNMGWSAATPPANISLSQNHNLTSNSVTSGAISIAQGVFTQNHLFSSANISLENVDIDTTTCIFSFDFAASDINYGTPTVGQTSISQIHNIEAVYNGSAADVPSLTVFEDETFSAPDVLTGTVRIAPAVFIQDHLFASADISTDQASIDSAVLTGNHVLTSDDVVTNAPTVSDGIYGVEFLSDDVLVQAPSVAQTTISQIHNLQPTISIGGVDVQTAAITQLHFLAGNNVIANNVEVQNTKNPWDVTTDTDEESYSEIVPPSKAWANVSDVSSPLFTETNDTTNPPFTESNINSSTWTQAA